MIGLNVQCTNGPAVGVTDPAEFLLDKRGKFPNQKLLAVFWAPDKMVAELVRDMLGMLRIHACHCNGCSHPCEVPVWGRLTPR